MAGLPTELRRLQMPLSKKVWPALGLFALRVRSVRGNSRRRRDDSSNSPSPAFAPSQILYFEFTRAGDLICATPFLAVLRRRWPEARITLAVYKEVAEVARGLPEVDRVEVFDRSDLWGSVKHLWRIRHAPDTLVLSHSINPLVALFFCLANAPASAGYLWSHAFVTMPGESVALSAVARPFGPLVEQRLDIARALGLSADPVPPVRFTLDTVAVGKEIRTVLETLARKRNEGRRIVALAPGSRSPNRRWPAAHFESLGNRLLKRPEVDLVIVGGPEDGALAAALGRSEPGRVIGAAGRTGFMEFAALIGASDVVVCNDSAALHVAAALRIPCVGMFGPVPPELRIHAMEGYRTVGLTGSRPCLCGYDFFSEKPCAHGTPCLTSLSPERVANAVEDLLGG